MDEAFEIAKLQEGVKNNKEDLKELKTEIALFSKSLAKEQARGDQLERRIVTHNAKHENNYKELQEEFKSLVNSLSHFKGDVLRRLDTMSGRDSVLKFLFGALFMGALGLLFGIIKSSIGY